MSLSNKILSNLEKLKQLLPENDATNKNFLKHDIKMEQKKLLTILSDTKVSIEDKQLMSDNMGILIETLSKFKIPIIEDFYKRLQSFENRQDAKEYYELLLKIYQKDEFRNDFYQKVKTDKSLSNYIKDYIKDYNEDNERIYNRVKSSKQEISKNINEIRIKKEKLYQSLTTDDCNIVKTHINEQKELFTTIIQKKNSDKSNKYKNEIGNYIEESLKTLCDLDFKFLKEKGDSFSAEDFMEIQHPITMFYRNVISDKQYVKNREFIPDQVWLHCIKEEFEGIHHYIGLEDNYWQGNEVICFLSECTAVVDQATNLLEKFNDQETKSEVSQMLAEDIKRICDRSIELFKHYIDLDKVDQANKKESLEKIYSFFTNNQLKDVFDKEYLSQQMKDLSYTSKILYQEMKEKNQMQEMMQY